MIDSPKMDFATFTWHVLPGINCFTLLVLLPYFVVYPMGFLENAANCLGATAIFGVLIGFLISSLKVYKLYPSYRKFKKKFFEEIEEVVNYGTNPPSERINGKDSFSALIMFLRRDKTHYPGNEHSIWVMVLCYSLICSLSAVEWALIGVFNILKLITVDGFLVFNNISLCCFITALFFLIISLRLMSVYKQLILEANRLYITQVKCYKKEIVELLKKSENGICIG